ncbi:hypothetical protein ACJDT4_09415 [Clostridium neuense]|uniref:Uncharacterized protein n=1 Tax=Clostridium neuense TaxID=1728934 RepID=A0ABW8TEK5_9CLOT
MNNYKNVKEVENKKFKIYTHNINKVLQELVYSNGGSVIYEDIYKANKKISFLGIQEFEMLYMINNNEYALHIAVPRDSYLSQIGINISEPECVVEMDDEQVIAYLESRVATDVILKYFGDKLIWDKHDITSPLLCYVKDRRVYDINKSYSLKVYTDVYIEFCEEKIEYEELYISVDNKFFLNLLSDSVRIVNSNLYFRNKEAEENEQDDILPMSEEEAVKWYLYRGGSFEEFRTNVERAKIYLSKIK